MSSAWSCGRWRTSRSAPSGSTPSACVPVREMPVPAGVVIGADVDAPRSVTALGMQFDVEPVEAAVLANQPH